MFCYSGKLTVLNSNVNNFSYQESPMFSFHCQVFHTAAAIIHNNIGKLKVFKISFSCSINRPGGSGAKRQDKQNSCQSSIQYSSIIYQYDIQLYLLYYLYRDGVCKLFPYATEI